VEDEDGKPLPGQAVHFEAANPDDVLTEEWNSANNGPKIEVKTRDDGIASVLWTFGKENLEDACRGVTAALTDPPQGHALVVRFQAGLAQAETPAVEWPKVDKIGWKNDQPLTLDEFNHPSYDPVSPEEWRGLVVRFTEEMLVDSVTTDTFIVTLEMPDVQNDWCAGWRSLIVPGDVQQVNQVDPQAPPTDWEFLPMELVSEAFSKWVDQVEKELDKFVEDDCKGMIRGRVVLKANAILDKEGKRCLDGEAFGMPSKNGSRPIGLRLPSGDGREGGDFESWFYLKE
jgi:hypothetical protein